MRKLTKIILALILVFTIDLFENKAIAQFNLSITRCETVADVIALIDTVFLDGVNQSQYKNISFTGDPHSVGYFTSGYIFGFQRPQGIVMSSGFAEDLEGNNTCSAQNASGNTTGGSDPDLNALTNLSINDACVIEFDFMPTGDSVRFVYVFGSEEYHDYVGSTFNDVFGFFLSGEGINGSYSNNSINIAQVPGTTIAVSINNVNCGTQTTYCAPPPGGGSNCEYLYDNTNQNKPTFNQTRLDAYTSPFVADNETMPCKWHHIKLAIGDAGDSAYDSGVFLEKGSFDPGSVCETTSYSHPTIDSILYESCNNHDAVIYFTIGSIRTTPYIIPYSIDTVTGNPATLGWDYTIIGSGHEDTIYIEAGSTYDSLIIRPFWDEEVEGIEDVRIIYNSIMCGFSVPDTALVMISDVPAFPDTNLVFSTYCEDTVIVGFNSVLEGIPPYTYLWTAGGQTTSTLQYIISGKDSMYLHCVITDTCGYQASDTAFVIVPNIVTSAGPDKSLCNQPSVQLEGSAPGAQTFLWTSTPPDATLAGQENDTTPIVSPVVTTEYLLLATDNCGNADQDTTIVDLEGAVAFAGTDQSMCLNDSVTISCNIGNIGESYLWTSDPPDAGLPGQDTNQTIVVSPLTVTNYSVLVTDGCDYSATDEVEVTVFDLPVANAGSNGEICLGSTYYLMASGGIHYQWGSIPADPSLTVNQQDTTFNPGITPDLLNIYKYYVEVTNANGCTSTDTMELTVNFVPDIILSADYDVICFGDTATISAIGDIADDYSWTADPFDPTIVNLNQAIITVTPDTTTVYSLVATVGGINCPANTVHTIIVIPQLFADFEIADNKFQTCENEAIGIFYTGNATGNANYSWDFGADAIINSGTGTGPYNVHWSTEGIKTISLTLTENNCPSDTVELDVTVIAMPFTDFLAYPDKGCAALEVSFTNLSSQLDNPVYDWTLDGTTIGDFEFSHIFNEPGTYPVSLTTTNQSICANTLTKNNLITVFEVPLADFDADPPETILEDGVIDFINISTSQDIMTYQWYFGDRDSSTLANPSHKYNAEGIYLVQLFATTSNGCQNNVSKNVTIHPDFAVFPPNAFTPNGDGENDTFEIKGAGISQYLLQVYSRWGELIFESTSLENHWDGTYNGNLVAIGTYVYSINYRSMLNREYTINGTVTVIR
ncbi:MAG: choice-of-anchor L domain-containing protein [Candidatus Brocadiales bacterium]|nr:choice-of-anchor L domain-containing protein [Candidatus Brocadiales bacterium]MBL6944802.1 choice-of-anchor L domain-containing protein [Bacteroidales bacterium]